MDDDATLLLAWRAGDATAGRTLVARHFPAVYRFFVNKIGADVDDLVQQTFLAMVEGRDRLRDPAGFRAYLFGVARNRLMRHLGERGRTDGECSVSDLQASLLSVAEAMAQRQQERLLLRSLRRLPVDLQIAIELAYFESMTDREVAEILEMPVGTLKSRLRKARMLLAEAIAEFGESGDVAESTTAGIGGWVASIRAQFDEATVHGAARD